MEKCNFQNFRRSMTLTLDWVTRHTVVHQSSTFIYTPNFIEIRKTFCGRTYGQTYGRTDVPTNGHFPTHVIMDLINGRRGDSGLQLTHRWARQSAQTLINKTQKTQVCVVNVNCQAYIFAAYRTHIGLRIHTSLVKKIKRENK